ncbi:FAD-binding domain-containing protein [Microthyrium microscopicum]|uniref:FAD-binding domain-containing protein n=1 Tax=Microthyrium microscopicum TaxID=703497 RepID=A0A6A6UFW9_9PEZI|nr:FAD-binding domain-containing protein [Microthyrium microscopicum]
MSVSDVVAAVKFANKWNLRISIKNTGHDFLGKNLGYGSLGIWVHNLKGIKWSNDWTPTATTQSQRLDKSNNIFENTTAQSVVIYGGGIQWKDLYSAAYTQKKIVTGGTSGSVGAAGGWLQGGGHGFFSNYKGLGVDNVLEFEVVLPTGEVAIANKNSHPDLFWALRGGGGGTWGIVTKVTMKTHDPTTLNGIKISVTPGSSGNAGYLKGMAYLLSVMPEWCDYGISGYPLMYSNIFRTLLSAPGKTMDEMNKFLDPYGKNLTAMGLKVTSYPVPDALNTLLISLNLALNDGLTEITEGDAGIMASRLLGRKGLQDVDGMAKVLGELFANGHVLEPFNIAGGAVEKSKESTGLNPAWRDAIVHMSILPLNQSKFTTNRQVLQSYVATQADISMLDKFSVQSAAYLNEASYLEPDWQKTFWGSNYPRLLKIKQKYDPNNTLWCYPCVGSEVFTRKDDGKLYIT